MKEQESLVCVVLSVPSYALLYAHLVCMLSLLAVDLIVVLNLFDKPLRKFSYHMNRGLFVWMWILDKAFERVLRLERFNMLTEDV